MLQTRIFAWIDRFLTNTFRLGGTLGLGTSGSEITQRIYYIGIGRGPTIGIVGVDGQIHTLIGYWSVRHYLEEGRVVRRVPVRKDLKKGERLATRGEIVAYQKKRQEEWARVPGQTIYG